MPTTPDATDADAREVYGPDTYRATRFGCWLSNRSAWKTVHQPLVGLPLSQVRVIGKDCLIVG